MAYKYAAIAEAVKKKILDGSYSPYYPLPTEQALCREFGASRQTVRSALQSLVDEGLVERRQGSGTYIRDGSSSDPSDTKTIAIVATYISDYIFPSILRSAEAVFSERNYTSAIYATGNLVSLERKVLQSLLALPKLDGLMVEGTKTALPTPNVDLYRKLRERGVPIVFFNGCYREFTDCYYVLDDNYTGGHMLAEYLVKQGHRRIAGIFKGDDAQGQMRYSGYASGLVENDIPFDDSVITWYTTALLEQEDIWRSMGESILEKLKRCTAVVCYNDQMANRVVELCARAGIRIPEDLCIVSFDNSFFSYLSSCKITSLSHGTENAGKVAATILTDLINGSPVESVVLPWELVEKESSILPPKK